jgi:hypothetical protein
MPGPQARPVRKALKDQPVRRVIRGRKVLPVPMVRVRRMPPASLTAGWW